MRLAKLYQNCTCVAANPNSQMCLFWLTDNPPDVLQFTEPMEAIQDEFDIDLSEIEAVELYDMSLQEASIYLQRKVEGCES